jgi:hypothetical protein
MPMWGATEYASGNQKPLYANTANVFGVSTTEMSGANAAVLQHAGWVDFKLGVGPIANIRPNVQANLAGRGYNTANFMVFTGGGGSGANASYQVDGQLVDIQILNAGIGYNVTNGYVTFTSTAGSGANAFYTTNSANGNAIATVTITANGTGYMNVLANTVTATINRANAVIATFTLTFANVINTITVNSGGEGYNAQVVATAAGINISPASMIVGLGGRGNRKFGEVLVAMGSITGDASTDNVFFSGV